MAEKKTKAAAPKGEQVKVKGYIPSLQKKYKEEITALSEAYKRMPTHSLLLYKIGSIYDIALKDEQNTKYYLELFISKIQQGVKDKYEKTGKDVDQMYLLSAKRRLDELKEKKLAQKNK